MTVCDSVLGSPGCKNICARKAGGKPWVHSLVPLPTTQMPFLMEMSLHLVKEALS